MAKKRVWKEPLVRSVDACQPVFGECKVGTTPTPGGPTQCAAGSGASNQGSCTRGNGAKNYCAQGNGVQ